jgi:hypothetical protein
MATCNRVDEYQPQADPRLQARHAARLDAVVTLEQARKILLRDARAAILHREHAVAVARNKSGRYRAARGLNFTALLSRFASARTSSNRSTRKTGAASCAARSSPTNRLTLATVFASRVGVTRADNRLDNLSTH